MHPSVLTLPLLALVTPPAFAAGSIRSDLTPTSNVITTTESVAAGPYAPTWPSLSNYQNAPEWFRDAKFGIWAHWGPNASPRRATGMPATCIPRETGNIRIT
jgi:alpha-L-fucosidase